MYKIDQMGTSHNDTPYLAFMGELQDFWNWNIIILIQFSWLAALEMVKMTKSSAASHENIVKIITFPFQWHLVWVFVRKLTML